MFRSGAGSPPNLTSLVYMLSSIKRLEDLIFVESTNFLDKSCLINQNEFTIKFSVKLMI
jgi:hypothetical protein